MHGNNGSRSRSGCFGCRRRKRRCDERRPACLACRSRGQSCDYPLNTALRSWRVIVGASLGHPKPVVSSRRNGTATSFFNISSEEVPGLQAAAQLCESLTRERDADEQEELFERVEERQDKPLLRRHVSSTSDLLFPLARPLQLSHLAGLESQLVQYCGLLRMPHPRGS